MRDIDTVARIGSPLLLQDKVQFAGREVLLDTALVPLRDNDEKITSVLGVARDITWRRNIEESKSKLESQLYQSQKMEAVGRLAGGVAHDFNNLLTAVLGYSDIALKRILPEDPLHREILQIREAAERATSLTRQLLAFSRKQILQPRVIDLAEVVLEVQKMLERLLGEDILLDVRCQPGKGKVKADPGQMQQVVLNLAVNARDAMPDGGTLTLEIRRVELGNEFVSVDAPVCAGGYIMLSISDTGCGMDLETQSHLFEPFFTTKLNGGTGLGLAAVHGIVTQSGGLISIQSQSGVGTTVNIYIPEFHSQAEPSDTESAGMQACRGTETVLLVEDSIQVRTLIRRILKSHGYRVLEAVDGPAAIKQSEGESGRIHLLLTDVVMPGMSGRVLAEHLKLVRPDMKILYMSGYTDDQVIMRGVIDSPYAFIQKPFRSESLALKVRTVLDNEQ
jgi:signal transduction histidine kinase